MADAADEYKEQLGILNKKLKDLLKDIVFLNLKGDIKLSNGCEIASDVPLPIKSDDLVSGVESGEFEDSISFRMIANGMIHVLGCDGEFKYNSSYVDILKTVADEAENYAMTAALKFIDGKDYVHALVFFNALDRISDKHRAAVRYNIANTLRYLAIENRDNGGTDYRMYYTVSFNKLKSLSADYPDMMEVHYYLGYYYMEEQQFKSAKSEWGKAYSLASDIDAKEELVKLLDLAEDSITFDESRRLITDGEATEGLKMMIPLVESHDDWSEAKYYEAMGYRKIGNYAKSELLLKELLDAGENFSELFNELGLCYFNTGDNQASIKNLRKAVELKPHEPGYLCNLALAYCSAEDGPNAKKYINEAYSIKPDDQVVAQCRSWIERTFGDI